MRTVTVAMTIAGVTVAVSAVIIDANNYDVSAQYHSNWCIYGRLNSCPAPQAHQTLVQHPWSREQFTISHKIGPQWISRITRLEAL